MMSIAPEANAAFKPAHPVSSIVVCNASEDVCLASLRTSIMWMMDMHVKLVSSHTIAWDIAAVAVTQQMRTTGSAMVRASAVNSRFVLTRDSTCCGYLASRLRITNRRAGTNTWRATEA